MHHHDATFKNDNFQRHIAVSETARCTKFLSRLRIFLPRSASIHFSVLLCVEQPLHLVSSRPERDLNLSRWRLYRRYTKVFLPNGEVAPGRIALCSTRDNASAQSSVSAWNETCTFFYTSSSPFFFLLVQTLEKLDVHGNSMEISWNCFIIVERSA